MALAFTSKHKLSTNNVLSRDNSETLYLLIDGSSVLAAVDVPQVQWITGEDDVVSTDGPLD